MPQTIRSENYVNIQGWMITELGLKNTELMVYALIYGFSQDGQGRFRGKLAYLMEWTQSSKPTVLGAIDRLIERGLIVKNEVQQLNGQRGVEYYAVPLEDAAPQTAGSAPQMAEDTPEELPKPAEDADDGGKKTLPGVKNFYPGGKEILPPRLKNFTDPVKKFYPDNNIDNKYNNYSDNQSIYQSMDGSMERIREQIEYDVLSDAYDGDLLDAVVQVLAEVEATQTPTVRIGAEDKPAAIVRSVFGKLTADDVARTLDDLRDYAATNEVANPRALLTTFLYNSRLGATKQICCGQFDFLNKRLNLKGD